MRIRIFFFIMSIFFTCSSIKAQWEQIGPYGTEVVSMCLFGNTIFAGGGGGWIFKSTDGGMNWSPSWKLANDDGSNVSGSVASMTVKDNMVFASTYNGRVLRSDDTGITWKTMVAHLPSTWAPLYTFGSYIFIGGQSGIYRSSDNGLNWTKSGFNSSTATPSTTVNSFSSIDSIIFVSTENGIYKSTDYGDNWDSLSISWFAAGLKLAHDEKYLYVLYANTMYRSSDLGKSWEIFSAPTPSGYTSTITVLGNNIYTLVSDSLFLSTDRGTTWHFLNHGFLSSLKDMYFSLTFILSDSNIFLFGAFNSDLPKIFRLDQKNSNWVLPTQGMAATRVNSLRKIDTTLFACTSSGLFTYSKENINWNKTSLINIEIEDVAGSFAASHYSGIYQSDNTGQTWTHLALNSEEIFYLLDFNNILVAGGLGTIYIPDYSGHNWISKPIPGGDSIYCLILDSAHFSLFAGTRNHGLLSSTNVGTTWDTVGLLGRHVYSILINNNTTFVVGTDSGIFLSSDKGANWTLIGLPNITIRCLTSDGSNLFVGTDDGRVFFSKNNGATWIESSRGLYQVQVTSLLVDNGYLFAGTDNASVWRTSLSDLTVKPVAMNQLILEQNYPNPFSSHTTISFSLMSSENITLKIFDVLGNKIATLANGYYDVGKHQVDWDAAAIPSGIYFYRLQGSDFSETRKLVIGY